MERKWRTCDVGAVEVGAGRGHIAGMMNIRSVLFAMAAAVLVGLALAGCTSTGNTGQYQTGGGGWDNFRA